MAGLFFCLASAEGAGLLFLPCYNTATHKRLQRLLYYSCKLYRPRYKIAHRAFLWLFRLFALFYTYYPAVHPAMLYSLRHAGGHTNAQSAYTETRYHRHAGRCTGQRSRPIIIRYIGVQRCASAIDPCKTVQHITDYSSPAGSRYFPRPAACNLAPVSGAGRSARHTPPGGAVQQQGRGGRRRTIGDCRRISFRAFAR